MNKASSPTGRKIILIVAIMIAIALLHIITGSHYSGQFPTFVNSYLIDILLPFGFTLLLCLLDNRIFQSWKVKALVVFSACFAVEVAQYFDYPLFGQTFDPWDILMYGLGVSLAVSCDTKLFPRLFSFWQLDSQSDRPELNSENNMFSWR